MDESDADLSGVAWDSSQGFLRDDMESIVRLLRGETGLTIGLGAIDAEMSSVKDRSFRNGLVRSLPRMNWKKTTGPALKRHLLL